MFCIAYSKVMLMVSEKVVSHNDPEKKYDIGKSIGSG